MTELTKEDLFPREGKYLLIRRDGTIPTWPAMILSAYDPAASSAVTAYADACEALGYDPVYVANFRELAAEFEDQAERHAGESDPDKPSTREDNPAIVALMRGEGDLQGFGRSEHTSAEVSALAAKGVATRGHGLTPEEIASVCGSALTQAPDAEQKP